jgi:hypothetical protein
MSNFPLHLVSSCSQVKGERRQSFSLKSLFSERMSQVASTQSENLPALLKVSSVTEIHEFQVDGASKQFVLPLRESGKKENRGSPGETGQLEIEVQLAPDK